MIIELPREVERFGAVRFEGLQKVYELDSGKKRSSTVFKNSNLRRVSYNDLYNIQEDMAIIVPVRSERLKLVEGVLCGIPHQCLVIIVSNSPKEPVNRFSMEEDALRDFTIFTQKKSLITHQKDPVLAKAFKKVNYTEILNKKGEIRDGKAEGMIIGTLMAYLAGKKYVGFVDADNYFPGAVEEYIREYAAGFHLSDTRYAMVRIAWHSKPKMIESKIFFRKWGRTSENTNRMLNRLISHYSGYETEIIKTGNAGEHAMTTDLAINLDYTSGFAIEPYHIVNLLEKFGGVLESPLKNIMSSKVIMYQIESRNPHLHDTGDDNHIAGMGFQAMQCVYHSPICPEKLKLELLREMKKRKFVAEKNSPPQLHYYPALSSINRQEFLKALKPSSYFDVLRQGNL